jgi:hypothetical protein
MDSVMDEKVIIPLVSGLVGGAIGSAITAFTSLTLWRRQQHTEASKVLWDYHYFLSASAAKAYEAINDEPGYSTLLDADYKGIKAALRMAYPYAGFLSQPAREKLFRGAWVDHGDYRDDYDDTYAKNLYQLAKLLENELDWVFPRRAGDRLRVIRRRWVAWRQEVRESRSKNLLTKKRREQARQKRNHALAARGSESEAEKEGGHE